MRKVVLIPGTTTIERVMENEVEVDLTEDVKKKIDLDVACCEAIGERYYSFAMMPVNDLELSWLYPALVMPRVPTGCLPGLLL